MTEVGYVAGRNLMSHLGKGKALLSLKVESVANSETITTPFTRCIPVITPGTTDASANAYSVTESSGVITFAQDAGTIPATMYVIMLGDLY